MDAAQRANAAVMIEIGKSKGGAEAYCAVSLWNIATYLDRFCNEMGITVPIAVHADHYRIKNEKDAFKVFCFLRHLLKVGCNPKRSNLGTLRYKVQFVFISST